MNTEKQKNNHAHPYIKKKLVLLDEFVTCRYRSADDDDGTHRVYLFFTSLTFTVLPMLIIFSIF